MEFFVIRDPGSYGDVATIWNFHKREWCWDLDGDYTAADGFAYASMQTAHVSAKRIIRRNLTSMHLPAVSNVRVVSRSELDRIRSDRRYD